MGEWILTSERLPEDGEEVLFCHTGSVKFGKFTEHESYWTHATGCFIEAIYREKFWATHWMPLPEPPEVCQKS